MSNFVYSFPGAKYEDKEPSTARFAHIRRLNDILHLSIEQQDYERARRAWSILVRCKEFDWKSMWRIGLLLTSHRQTENTGEESGSLSESLEYLKGMMLKYPDDREAILQETTLRLAEAGRYRHALDNLDLYLPSFPYQENPTLHTYAGMLSLQLAIHQGGTPYDEYISLLRKSSESFGRAISLDADNVVAVNFQKEVSDRLEYAPQNSRGVENTDQNSDEEDMQVDEGVDERRKRTRT